METGDFESIRHEQDIILYVQNNSLENPGLKIEEKENRISSRQQPGTTKCGLFLPKALSRNRVRIISAGTLTQADSVEPSPPPKPACHRVAGLTQIADPGLAPAVGYFACASRVKSATISIPVATFPNSTETSPGTPGLAVLS